MDSKLNILLQLWPYGGIATSEWLESLGIYKQLRRKYIENHWIEAFGYGAFKRAGDKVSWEGALESLQKQLNKPIHIGAKSALEIKGYAHYIPLKESKIVLFGSPETKLPKWFSGKNLNIKVQYHKTSFLKTDE